jgi:hypothetical protein
MDNITLIKCFSIIIAGSRIKSGAVMDQEEFNHHGYSRSTLPGMWILLHNHHWYLLHLYLDNSGKVLANIFDSYGNNAILNYGLIVKEVSSYQFNPREVQSSETLTCGLFCLYAAYFLSRGFSMPKLVSRFDNNVKKNERKVINFFIRIGCEDKPKYRVLVCTCRSSNGL